LLNFLIFSATFFHYAVLLALVVVVAVAADVATVVCVINSNAWGAGSALISQLGNFHLIGCTSRDFRL